MSVDLEDCREIIRDLEDEIETHLSTNHMLTEWNKRLREALTLFRSLVKEGGVPRYTVTPGAALNSVIEEVVDPALERRGR